MTSFQFFRYCRELVKTNWTWRVHNPHGAIGMVPIIESFDGEHNDDFHPIAAVALTLTGFRSTDPRDIWRAAHQIELSPTNTTIIFTAALMAHGLDGRTLEVRSEILDHLRIDGTKPVKIGRYSDRKAGVMSDDLKARHDYAVEPPMMRWTRFMRSLETN
jgi:hypothetical protein